MSKMTMMPGGKLADDVLEQAAEWQVKLSSHTGSQSDLRAIRMRYEAWKQAAPEHMQAAARLESLLDDARAISCTPAHAQAGQQALTETIVSTQRRRTVRRAAFGVLLALALVAPLAWLDVNHSSLAQLTADVHTRAGNWQTVTLEDGTRLTLGSGSAANYHYDGQRRELALVSGEFMVEVAKDPERPFLVRTPEARITALGTQFSVSRQQEGVTVLTMLESKVDLRRAQAPEQAGLVVQQGQRVHIWADRIGPVEVVDVPAEQAYWKDHKLVVNRMPLPEVLATLGRQRSGFVYFDRAALAPYALSGALDLDDPLQALRLLETSFPIRIRSYTPWLIYVEKSEKSASGG